jgi:ATP-dependent helicase/nuclease subunit B
MVHRIFGRKKYGKTEFVFSSIKNNIENRKRSFLIVPEQYSLSMERRLVRDFGNKANMYVEVLGFTRLCNRVFRESGGLSQTFLDEAGKLLCMTKALSMLSNELCQYEKSSDTAEFARSSVRACQELSMYGVSPSMLEKASVELCDRNSVLSGKMRDLSLICATYRSVLKNAYSTDGEDLDRLADALSEYNFFVPFIIDVVACQIIDLLHA